MDNELHARCVKDISHNKNQQNVAVQKA